MGNDTKNNSDFPSVNRLFADSWQTFTYSLHSLFILNILGIVIYLLLAAVAIITFIISGVGSSLLQQGMAGITSSLISPAFLITIAVLSVVFVCLFAIISSALQIATILIVDAKGKLSVGTSLKKSLGLILPLFFVGIFTCILTFGAFFVFVFPAILVVFLIGFAQFEIILNNKRGLEAIKRSVLLISSNFGAIFIRTILLWLLYFGVFLLMNILENIFPQNSQWVISIFSFFFNMLLGWFAICYQIILYRHASLGLENQKGKGIAWMWILALVGWLMAGLLIYGGWKLSSSPFFQDLSKNFNTSLGSSMQRSIDEMSPEAKVHYDKSQALFDEIRANQNNAEAVIKLNDENISELKKAVEVEPNNPKIWFELGNAYTWISSSGTLEDSLESYQKAESLEPKNAVYIDNVAEILIRLERYEEAVLKLKQSLRVGEKLDDESGLTHYRIGVAYSGLKIYDSARTHLQKAIDILSDKNSTGRFDDEILRAQKDLSNLPK